MSQQRKCVMFYQKMAQILRHFCVLSNLCKLKGVSFVAEKCEWPPSCISNSEIVKCLNNFCENQPKLLVFVVEQLKHKATSLAV